MPVITTRTETDRSAACAAPSHSSSSAIAPPHAAHTDCQDRSRPCLGGLVGLASRFLPRRHPPIPSSYCAVPGAAVAALMAFLCHHVLHLATPRLGHPPRCSLATAWRRHSPHCSAQCLPCLFLPFYGPDGALPKIAWPVGSVGKVRLSNSRVKPRQSFLLPLGFGTRLEPMRRRDRQRKHALATHPTLWPLAVPLCILCLLKPSPSFPAPDTSRTDIRR